MELNGITVLKLSRKNIETKGDAKERSSWVLRWIGLIFQIILNKETVSPTTVGSSKLLGNLTV